METKSILDIEIPETQEKELSGKEYMNIYQKLKEYKSVYSVFTSPDCKYSWNDIKLVYDEILRLESLPREERSSETIDIAVFIMDH